MKKVILMLSLICMIFLVGCNNNEVDEINNPEVFEPSGEESGQISYLSFKYTDLENLKAEGVVPEKFNEDKFYDVGNVKLGDKVYEVKFIAAKTTVDYYYGEFIEEKLVFFDGENEVKSFVLKTENGFDDYSREISIFKDKYVVTISANGAGDSLQSLNIYDENLEVVHVKYIDGTEDDLYIDKFGDLRLHQGYENHYLINDEDITYIRTENSAEKGSEKVTIKVTETANGLGAEVIERTKDGVMEYAGRIF